MTAQNGKHISTRGQFQVQLEEAMQQVEKAMLDVVTSDVDELRDASRHILSAGGKRIRPRLLMLSYMATGGSDFAYAAPPAGAIELMHTASVVHDDINDHGVLRRGRPSVNAIWGRTFALLTGDFLFTTVYKLAAPYKDLNVDLANAAMALVEGETMQASAVKNNNFSREIYAQIIGLKTAALFEAAGSIGAKLAGAPEEQVRALGRYGYNVGLAFQIVDDILDIIGDEQTLGKTSGIDVSQGRGFTSAYQNGGGAAVAEAPASEDLMESIKRKLLKGDALAEAEQQAQALITIAIDALDVLPSSAARDELVKLAELVVHRDH